MKLLLDMNLSRHWVAPLISLGHDAVHWRDIGEPTATDFEIMACARSQGRVVMTHDLDFGDILAVTGGTGPSVVQLRSADLRVETALQRVAESLITAAEALAAGALVSIDMRRARIRLLPLRPIG